MTAEPGLVVEEVTTGWCGAVVEVTKDTVSLEDRHGRVRVFPLSPAGYALDGQTVTLVRPVRAPTVPARTASGSRAVPGLRARVARAGRIWVEGRHDAELVERVWGHDLRVEGVVVEELGGADHLAAHIGDFRPGPGRRVGVLLDHLVADSKESRLASGIRHEDVLVVGHPYVDVWQAVKPSVVGLPAWPVVPPGRDWKQGVCAALGWGEPWEGWRRVLACVQGWTDLEVPLLQSVERLIDFVTSSEEA